MAASKAQANWTAVQFNSVALTRITNVSFDKGGSLTPVQGDTDVFPTLLVSLGQNPSASVTSLDPASLMAIAPGTTGTFTATHKDAAKQTAGDIVYVMANAVAETGGTTGQNAAIGTATQSFKAYSSDGTTNPLSFTRS
ncbi:hypothetical protein [Paludisphaera rhizosphaerae]|uniref:hypothetical protein n=1 Tax=Paludisphaera rhizosphaerae TaxID=2711216 RepID=UPI0013ED6D64|nr:hypothetical protein [Paludisphaera rhizosphaerae]